MTNLFNDIDNEELIERTTDKAINSVLDEVFKEISITKGNEEEAEIATPLRMECFSNVAIKLMGLLSSYDKELWNQVLFAIICCSKKEEDEDNTPRPYIIAVKFNDVKGIEQRDIFAFKTEEDRSDFISEISEDDNDGSLEYITTEDFEGTLQISK